MTSFARARDTFLAGYLRAHPEEATTLGLRAFDGEVRDVTERGIDDELETMRCFVTDLAKLDRSTLSLDDELDARALERHARFRARALSELELPRRSLEASIHPHAMLAHHAAHVARAADWEPFERRLASFPSLYRDLETNLRSGLARGHVPDRALTRSFADDLLPAAARWLEGVARLPAQRGHTLSPARHASLTRAGDRAAAALREHAAFLRSEVAPRAADAFSLGGEEVERRLREQLGITRSAEELSAEAEARLHDARAELVARADRFARSTGGAVTSFEDAAKIVRALFTQPLARSEDVVPLYEKLTERARAFVVERDLFRLPSAFRLSVIPLPPGVAHGTAATNWPAPLTDPLGEGHVAVSLDPSLHSRVAAANLAVHEGLPGHTLQSAAFQASVTADADPTRRLARYLALADDEAMAQSYFGPMLDVEGFAVWAEELLLAEGYLAPDEAICAVASKAIRAARVVADLGLHVGRLDREDAATFLAEATGMPIAWARAQALRYTRIPLQALTYDLGKQEIERLYVAERRAQGARFSIADFHERMLAAGPLWPSEIALTLAQPG